MYGDQGGHHDAHSQLAPDNPTWEACYSGASKSPFFFFFYLLWLSTFYVCFVFTPCSCFVRCYPSVCVAQERVRRECCCSDRVQTWLRELFWDVVKHPYHCQSLPPATTTNTRPYVGLSGMPPSCHSVGANHSATDNLRASRGGQAGWWDHENNSNRQNHMRVC